MFSKTIIDSDLFLDLPTQSQNLYFHLSMRADDEGFVKNPKRIARMIGANSDDFDILIKKELIIVFDSGIALIVHWKVHNYVRTDRFKPTDCIDERTKVHLENNIYVLGIPSDNLLDTQVRLGKDRLGKVRLSKDNAQAEPAKNQKHLIGEYKNVLLSDLEIEKLKSKFGSTYDEKIQKFSQGLELKDYKYKNHYLAILKWFEADIPEKDDLIFNNISIPVWKKEDNL